MFCVGLCTADPAANPCATHCIVNPFKKILYQAISGSGDSMESLKENSMGLYEVNQNALWVHNGTLNSLAFLT